MMNIMATPIYGVYSVKTQPFQDERGSFYRAFCDRQLGELLQGEIVRQVNVSRTEIVGAIRGMHFQYPPHAEIKMVRCLQGRVWDVVLDLRKDSTTFLQWHPIELSPDNAEMLVIPKGCAHGFQVLATGSELLYLHTAYYEPSSEGGVRYNDPKIGISWPLRVTDISSRDAAHSLLSDEFEGISL